MHSPYGEIDAILYPALPNTLGITKVFSSGYSMRVKAFLSEMNCKTSNAINNLNLADITIISSINEITNYDAVVLLQPPQTRLLKYDVGLIKRLVEYALQNGKLVVCNLTLESTILKRFREMNRLYEGVFEYVVPQYIPVEPQHGIPLKLTAKTILVGSVIPDVESLSLSFEIINRLSRNHRIAAFTTSENGNLLGMVSLYPYFNTPLLLNEERIEMVKAVIQAQSEQSNPDIILIHINEAMMEYTEVITQGYGIVPYFISRILRPDIFACGFPLNLCNESVIKSISDDISGRFGFAVDYAFTTNVLIDSTSAQNLEHVSIVHCDSDLTSRIVGSSFHNSPIPLSVCIDSHGVDCLSSMLENELEELGQIDKLFY